MIFIQTKHGYVNVDKIHGFYIWNKKYGSKKEVFHVVADTGNAYEWVLEEFDTQAEAQAALDKIIKELEEIKWTKSNSN